MKGDINECHQTLKGTEVCVCVCEMIASSKTLCLWQTAVSLLDICCALWPYSHANATIRGSHGSEYEDYGLTLCDGMQFGNWVPKVRKNLMPPSCGTI